MKQGWIQVKNNGAQEQLAPKSMADMVYVDEAQTKTVKAALAEGFVAVFKHTMTTVNGNRVHNLEGPSSFMGIGRTWLNNEIQSGDQVTVNGQTRTAYLGGETPFTLSRGHWEIFVVDPTTVNFKSGGTEKNYRVIAVDSVAALPPTALENTFAIITGTAIGNLRFCPGQPLSATNGDVWIRTFDSHRAVSVNMSKGDWIYMYPVGARQYVGSAWVNKTARIYQKSAWKNIIPYLYNAGTFVVAGADEIHYGSVTRNSVSYYCLTQAGKSYPYAGISWAVDLTNVNNVYAELKASEHSGEINVRTLTDTLAAQKLISQSTIFAAYSLDVSALKGIHKIYVGTKRDGSPVDYKETTVKNVYLT